MITGIKMENIKGQNCTQQLSGRDIITGHNGAGKTTRMQALSLAILGYVPGMDKKNSAVFELSSHPEKMSVGLETDELEFIRTFTRKEKLNTDGSTDTSFSQKISLSPSEGESTNTQKEARIKSVMGNFPVMLDFSSFIAMSDMQQRDFIYSLSGQTDLWDREYIINRVKSYLLTDTLRENNPDMYEIMVENVEDVISCYNKKLDMSKGILAMVERAKTQRNYWNQEKGKADGAAQKLAEMKNRFNETDRDLAANIASKKALELKKERLIGQIATYEAGNRSYKAAQVEIAELQERLEAQQNIDAERMVEALKADIQENPYIQQIEELEEKLTAWKAEAEKYNHLVADKAEVDAGIKVTKKMISDLEKNVGKCAINPSIPCHQDFSQYIEGYKEDLSAWTLKKMHLDEQFEEFETLREFIVTAQDMQDRAIHEKNRIEKENADIQAEINKILSTNYDESNAFIIERIEVLKKQLEDEPYVDLDPYELEKEALTGEIMALQAKIDEQRKIRTTLSSIRENMIDSDEAAYQLLTWKQIAEVLGQKGIQGEIVKQMLDPIRDAVSEKLRALQADDGSDIKEFYFQTTNDNGKENFVFGWSGADGNIPFGSLSNGEQLLLMVALMVVIIEKSGAPVKILALDNLDKLDNENLKRVIKGIDAIGQNMDNVILSGVMNVQESDAEGWKITRL